MPWVGIGLVGVGQVAQRHPEMGLHLLLWGQALALGLALSLVRFRIPVPPPSRERYPLSRLLFFLPAAFGQTFAPALVSLFLLRFAKERLGLEPVQLGVLLLLGGGLAFGLLPSPGAWWTGGATAWPWWEGSAFWGWPWGAWPSPPPWGRWPFWSFWPGWASACSCPAGTASWPRTCPRKTAPPSGAP